MNHWKCEIPAGVCGTAEIEKFTVSEDQSKFTALRPRDGYVPAGDYTRLMIDRKLVMSDTPQERRQHSEFIRRATGNVLIHGLGLGCCLAEVLAKPDVEAVTVIELRSDVINLVAHHFPQATIIQSDARTWKPPKNTRFNAVWHDIWSDICVDNLPEMVNLHRRYGRRTDWQGSWSRSELKRWSN